MTDLNKMFPEFAEMDFKKRDVVILPVKSIADNWGRDNIFNCPHELLWTGKLHLKELEELYNCTEEREKELSCYECWRRASEIVMKHYFGEGRDGKKKS